MFYYRSFRLNWESYISCPLLPFFPWQIFGHNSHKNITTADIIKFTFSHINHDIGMSWYSELKMDTSCKRHSRGFVENLSSFL